MILTAASGGMEIGVLIMFAIIIGVVFTPAALVYRGVRKRNTNHPYAWPAMAFFATVPSGIGLLPFAVFYWTVRDEIGETKSNE